MRGSPRGLQSVFDLVDGRILKTRFKLLYLHNYKVAFIKRMPELDTSKQFGETYFYTKHFFSNFKKAFLLIVNVNSAHQLNFQMI